MIPPAYSEKCQTLDCNVALTAENRHYIEGIWYCYGCVLRRDSALRAEREVINRERLCELKRHRLVRETFPCVTFETSDPRLEAGNEDSWEIARSETRNNFFIYGPVGAGKSCVAECVLYREFERGRTVAVVDALSFTDTADQYYNKSAKELLNRWQNVSVLLFDDVLKGKWNLNVMKAWWKLMEERHYGRRRTLITSEHTVFDLRDKLREALSKKGEDYDSLPDAIIDRLKLDTIVTKLEMRGRSRR